MNILGLSGGVRSGNQDGAAALLIDGQLVAAAEEERFVGIKFANGLLPKNAIRFCLKQAGLSIHDIDLMVFAGATYESFSDILRRFLSFHFGHAPKVTLVDHHLAHAASTYYGSGWDPALIVTMDFSGDRKSTTVSVGQDGHIRLLEEMRKPDSLGIYYSSVTQYLGFQKDSDEYKVMGMAAYGQPRYDFSHILEVTETGYRFHHDFIRGVRSDEPAPSKQERLFDSFPMPIPPRLPGSPITQEHFDLATSAQVQLERGVLQLVKHYTALTGIDQVCLAGGVALNCLMVQEVRESDFVSRVYAPPVCSDAGLALGAAYIEAVNVGDQVDAVRHAYWGPEFGPDEIRLVLDRAHASYREVNDPVELASRLIADGKIVGWFQGRMEFGPRALGNRSILANPQVAAMKDEINQRVKFREEFRPLAPSVRQEDGATYFARYCDSPYMTQTFTATDRTRREAPAIAHADGTSRIQSVDASTNPLYDQLITSVGARTGLPMVLNTSLNAYGDPIACEPFHAIRTFFTTGLDALFMSTFVLEKGR
jgi:carbamoyltransferase